MENKETVEKLMEKYLDRNCTEQEIRLLLEYFDQPQNESTLKESIARYFENEKAMGLIDPLEEAAAINEVHSRLMTGINEKKGKIRSINWFRVSAAASVVILMGLSAWFYYNYDGSSSQLTQEQKLSALNEPEEILEYLDTTRMPLSNRKVETVADQGTRVLKSNNRKGEVAISESVNVGDITYKKVIIPRGGQYEITLSDKTRVWLNAGSTIVFPLAFSGDERRVKITGEVYFEVAPIAMADSEKIPFIVSANNTEIKVLGTHFNVNSWPDANGTVRTTLLEGSVEVSSLVSKKKSVIKPGQQAITGQLGELTIKQVNTEEVVAWKNGYFYFNNTNLRNIMQELSRWYDVKVVYDERIPERKFTGKIQKDLSLAEVIELLKYTNVNIRVDDNCIIVTQ